MISATMPAAPITIQVSGVLIQNSTGTITSNVTKSSSVESSRPVMKSRTLEIWPT